ncbi:ThiF family adenylyltransferase [Rhodococcus jostii]|uniref:ThiF family adenylyltransferase n=1 Tax=Rhodococcus jostii TaxID=132919 RepID=A0ABU4CTV9_RHOJO|nr:ThiF family adenylyltransferase [Rhodococcus jostii]MDV6286645.1 ThiF family adenylyltransferase [Rhodococcus jostii]
MVIALSSEHEPIRPCGDRLRTHFLTRGDAGPVGRWFRVDEATNLAWVQAITRGAGYPTARFKDQIAIGFVKPISGAYIALTFAPDLSDRAREARIPTVAAWFVTNDGVHPVAVDIEPDQLGVARLHPKWPVDILQQKNVTVVGTGSIGSAAAHALALSGVGTLNLVDPDRLLSHNLVRHTSSPRHVGKKKVDALKIEIEALRPDTRVVPYPINAITAANRMRELLQSTDIVLCASDGVASRRTTGHLARRAGKVAVLACVLEDGALGEILRLRPWPDHGCLTCRRDELRERGSIDPEPALNLPYGEGTQHRPMTAVGSDLQLVGQHAAKATVATLLEAAGIPDQRLPGEHMLLALRPTPDWPTPFDLRRASEIRWLPATPPKPGCPTCEQT